MDFGAMQPQQLQPDFGFLDQQQIPEFQDPLKTQFIRDEQGKITVTQKEGVYTSDQVKSNIYKQLPKILQMLESQGSIKIMDTNILNN